jgi:non-ribosomal peptide synthetase component F
MYLPPETTVSPSSFFLTPEMSVAGLPIAGGDERGAQGLDGGHVRRGLAGRRIDGLASGDGWRNLAAQGRPTR